jgi:hypothetical protein
MITKVEKSGIVTYKTVALTKENAEITVSCAKKKEEFSKYMSSVYVTVFVKVKDGLIENDILVNLNLDRSDYGLFSRQGKDVSVKYNGLRTDKSKLDKYNKKVDEITEWLEENEESLIQKAFAEITEIAERKVKRYNENKIQHMGEQYTNVKLWNFEDKDYKGELKEHANELSHVDAQIKLLKDKRDKLREKVRVGQVEIVTDYINNHDYDDNVRAGLIEAVKAPKALSVNNGMRLRF